MLGNSYGGYLANLAAKISPWNVNAIIDNSSFVNFSNYIWRLIGFGKELDFTKFHGTYDKTLFKNITLYLSDKTFWTSNKESKNYFSTARKLIREPLNKDHIKIQAKCFKTKYISYHSVFDERVPYKDKKEFYDLLRQNGFDATLHSVDKIDSKFIKNLKHGMGISTKLLIKKELPSLLLEFKKQKYINDKKQITYLSDDLSYTFKEENDKIILKVIKDYKND